jgi:amino acid transporter
MAARVAYGMARRSGAAAPSWLADVHPATQTPIKATALMTITILVLALFFPLVTLAEATSTIILIVFALLNVSLWRMKRRGDPLPDGAPCYPIVLPVLGFAACLGLLAFHLWSAVS